MNNPNTESRDGIAKTLWALRALCRGKGFPARNSKSIIKNLRAGRGLTKDIPPKITGHNVDEYIGRAIDSLVHYKSQVCPALPCGADDHWIENNLENIGYAEEWLIELISFKARLIRADKHHPGIHEFDEQYFSS